MKRIFTLLAALMLSASASFAQRNLYCWGKDGNVSIEPASQIDSLTFGLGIQLFQISKPANLGVTINSFQGSTKVSLAENVKSMDVAPEIGICYSEENSEPTCADMILKLGNAMQEYSFTIKDFVSSGTTYHYRTYVHLLDEIYYGPVNTITTMGDKPTDKVINGHQFIDLGLSSGLLWAETNVGASVAPLYGDYFAWGETETKSTYDWDTYKWTGTPSKYNLTDKKTILDAEDDVATAEWGEGCRMPTYAEFQELLDECEWSLQRNWAYGYVVKGPNGNSIFLPVSDFRNENSPYYQGYWSSSLCLENRNINVAYYLHVEERSKLLSRNFRNVGFLVRPVAEK